ncbi:MAG: DUF4268 domain-containing protein [Anaerolineae bacterium]|nr:DUF4268 domain-containing protein [Anaerolineae bacterium]
MNVGKLQRVSLREVWPNEAYDFTPWLQENLDVLNEVLGLSLGGAEREQAAGSFSLDLLAEDALGNPVIIENQLERSDHDHLGKLLTYLVAFDASTAIWIVAEPRPEHVAAVQWLNEASSGSFYLVMVEAVCIGDSAPAPLLTEIVGPSEEAREVGETKRGLSERQYLRYQFWGELLERSSTRTDLPANISPANGSWISTGAGISGVGFNYVTTKQKSRSELWINRKDQAENKSIFDQLYIHKEAIENAFGAGLDWQRMDSNRASRIAYYVDGGYREDNWEETHDAMIDVMIRLEAALRPYIDLLEI